jgi:hypothetical protein
LNNSATKFGTLKLTDQQAAMLNALAKLHCHNPNRTYNCEEIVAQAKKGSFCSELTVRDVCAVKKNLISLGLVEDCHFGFKIADAGLKVDLTPEPESSELEEV